MPVLLEIFKRKYQPGLVRLTFDLNEVRSIAAELGIQGRNWPDMIYRMKSRTVIPAEIQAYGFRIIEITSRGEYALIVGESTLIDYPPRSPSKEIVIKDRTPKPVRKLLGPNFGSIDEQGLLSVLRYNDLFSHFLGTRSFHFKSHVRKSVPGVGQAEIDDVHIALASASEDGGLVVVPVEAKAKDDPVNRTQITMQIRYAAHAFPTLPIRPLAVKLFEDGLILFMEFNVTTDPVKLVIMRHAQYRLR